MQTGRSARALRGLLLLLAPWLGACASAPVSYEGLRPAPAPLLRSPARAAALPPSGESLYRIGAGDTLSVVVHGQEDLTLKETVVLPDGLLPVPLVGQVRAAERTIDDLRADLERRLAPYVVDARVSISVVKAGSQRFTVLGRVDTPGVYPLEPGMRLLDGLARAGGLFSRGQFRSSTVEVADLQNAVLIRRGQVLGVSFRALVNDSDMTQNVPLEAGDTIFVPSSLSKEVSVLGEVRSPQTVGFIDSLTLTQALARAEGTVFYGKSSVHVVRRTAEGTRGYVIPLDPILTGKEPDVQLEPGDIVYVPPTPLAMWYRTFIQLLPFASMAQPALMYAK